MAEQEIDSFIKKFKFLWKSGFDAHMDVDTHAGQAWVGLRVGLGVHGPPQPIKSSKLKDSPCRQRRRVKREGARQVQAEEAAKKEDGSETVLVAEESIENSENENENTEEVIIQNDEDVKIVATKDTIGNPETKSEVAEEVVKLHDENSECEVKNDCRTSVPEETCEKDIVSHEIKINDVAIDPAEEKPADEQVKNTVAEHPATV